MFDPYQTLTRKKSEKGETYVSPTTCKRIQYWDTYQYTVMILTSEGILSKPQLSSSRAEQNTCKFSPTVSRSRRAVIPYCSKIVAFPIPVTNENLRSNTVYVTEEVYTPDSSSIFGD